ncbi:MAG: hypothetical protein MI723_15360, partial [Caulobacterales bacterium]|nr:hypothetical protein [Caulobacterales bacterium]
HPFIYTPFAAAGWLPGLGSITMGGMPGMNAAGVAYVHHGGGSHMLEPKSAWGYGVRRGASVMHLMRYFSSAKDMRDQELAWPVGDVGGIFGNPGAFYADNRYGYVLESRVRDREHPMGLIREGTYDAHGALRPFLFATNNSQHPDAAGSHCVPAEHQHYDLKSGWTTLDPNVIGAPGEPAEIWHRWWTKASEGRNRFLFDHLTERYGRIDTDWLAQLYRTQGDYPSEDEWEGCMAAFKAGGALYGSSANRGNAFVAIMEPRNGDDGLFKACIGPAARGLPPKDAGHGFYYYDETAAFWTIRLAASPKEMVEDALARARSNMERADNAITKLTSAFGGRASLERFQRQAHEAFAEGRQLLADSDSTTRTLSKALRAFTRAQVRANQVIDAVEPPESL